MYAVADFCLIPMGTAEASVTKYIAECQRVLEASGLTYQLRGYGTELEGEWMDVMAAIQRCHEAVHAMGVPRVATDIRIGTRTDKKSSNAHKQQAVIDFLASASTKHDAPSAENTQR